MNTRKAAIYALVFIAIGPPIGSLLFSIPITLLMDTSSFNSPTRGPSATEKILAIGLLSYIFGALPAAAAGITYGSILEKASSIKLYFSTAAAGLITAALLCLIIDPQPNLNYLFLLIPAIFASILTTAIINLFR